MPFDKTADFFTQLPSELTGHVASHLDRANLHAFRQTSKHVAAHSEPEFAARYLRTLDIRVLGTPLRRTNDVLSDNTSLAGFVRAIEFSDRGGQFGNVQSQLMNIAQLLARLQLVNSVRIQTHRIQNSRVVFQSLTTPVLPISRLINLDLTPDERNPRPPRFSTQDILTLLTRYSQTLRTLSLDSAILPTALAWQPIFVYIRDHLSLNSFRFAHYEYSNTAPDALFELDEESPIIFNCGVKNEEVVRIEGSEAEMKGEEAVQRGANRLLMILELGGFDARLPA